MLTARCFPLLLTLGAALPAQDVFPYPYHIDDLPNGLRLVTIPTDFPDIVSVHIVVATGSRNEVEEGKSGFAHFFEHMMFRGTKNYSPAQQAAIFKKAGADRNAYTTNDYTNYHTTFSKEDLESVLMLEADRFRNLSYEQKAFRTEAMAVLGEYNKNSQNPLNKIFEVMRDKAFQAHTYKHTTMGFLRDIRTMPRQFDYSREFFKRWYKPEYTTILIVGDVERERTLELVQNYWGSWERGDHTVEVPEEPRQDGPLSCHIAWPSPTQPWVVVGFKGPAFSTSEKDMPTLDVIQSLGFSENSEIYRKLFVREQKVSALFPYFPDSTDPFLLFIGARVKDPADVSYVRDEIIAACERLKTDPAPEVELARVKANLKYGFAAALDSSEAIASSLAGYIARARTPDAVNKVYGLYDQVTQADVMAAARKYFVTSGRTIATLSHGDLPSEEAASGAGIEALASAVLQPTQSPLVSFRLVFGTGAASDPDGQEGVSYVTARLLTNGSTSERSFEEIVSALFPMASGVGYQVDKQMTAFYGTVHRDNLEAFYGILKEMLLSPGWKEADLARVKANTKSYLEVELRGNNDEELGKEVMYNEIYRDHPYGHHNAGAIDAIDKLTLADVQAFYRAAYRPSSLVLGLAGGYPEGFAERVANDFANGLPPDSGDGGAARPDIPTPAPVERNRMTIVEKNTISTGIHIGFPIEVTRAHPDWAALWLVRSYFGEHRSENSYLYQRLREIRGLNYGDYSYIEYFPGGMFQFHPDPNLARDQQIFQIWIRPVPPANGPFATRAAFYELQKLVENGMTQESFEATRTYLSKFVNLLVKTQDRRLGYAIDSRAYGTEEFAPFVKKALAELTLEDVNRAIAKHLRADRLQYVIVTKDAEDFKKKITSADPTPCNYQAKPPAEILEEDKVIERMNLNLREEDVVVVPVERVFR